MAAEAGGALFGFGLFIGLVTQTEAASISAAIAVAHDPGASGNTLAMAFRTDR